MASFGNYAEFHQLEARIGLQAWLRVVAGSIMFYDFVITMPTALRMYRRQERILRPSYACIFFFLARYVGLAAVIASLSIFFRVGSQAQCIHLIPIVGSLRSILSTVTNVILFGRTWVIWGRDRNIAIIMGIAIIPTTIFSYSYLFLQTPLSRNGACTALSGVGVLAHKWLFAAANMGFDVLICTLCTIRLVANIHAEKHVQGLSHISHILLQDGLGYFVIVMIGHCVNLVFLLSPSPAKQTAFLTCGVVINSILAQRIITSLFERTSNNNSGSGSGSSLHFKSHARSCSDSSTQSKSKAKAGVPGVPQSRVLCDQPKGRSAFTSFKQSLSLNGHKNENGHGHGHGHEHDIELGVKTQPTSPINPIAIEVHLEKITAHDLHDLDESTYSSRESGQSFVPPLALR